MGIKIIKEKISSDEFRRIAEDNFGNMVKAVVDIANEIIALGGELHSDANEVLIEDGAKQPNIWGINIYSDKPKETRIEFDSLINIRPSMGNRSLKVEDEIIRNKIATIVDNLIE